MSAQGDLKVEPLVPAHQPRPHLLAALHKLALSLIQRTGPWGIAQRRPTFAAHPSRAFTLLLPHLAPAYCVLAQKHGATDPGDIALWHAVAWAHSGAARSNEPRPYVRSALRKGACQRGFYRIRKGSICATHRRCAPQCAMHTAAQRIGVIVPTNSPPSIRARRHARRLRAAIRTRRPLRADRRAASRARADQEHAASGWSDWVRDAGARLSR